MPYEESKTRPEAAHHVILEEREQLAVSGVEEVESFDETAVALHTVRGLLIVHGAQLHLRSLSTDGGQIEITGQVDTLSYEAEQKRGSFLRRLFG